MVSTEDELKSDVRQMTGYTSTLVFSDDSLDTAYRNAKRHIRVKKALTSDYDWYNTDNPAAQEALFWYTCLFSKVRTGELDSQDFQAGAVDQNALLAKDDDEVTTWYRNAQAGLQSLKASSIIQSSSPSRSEREYTLPGFSRDSSGGSGGDSLGSGL